MRRSKILLVDDEESILKGLCRDFEEEGYEVTTASEGGAAIEFIKAEPFDMVVTDLSMPGIDGIEVLNKAKTLIPDIIVIILTGYGDLTSAIAALRLGADDYLLKPCDSDELLLRTSRCLAKQAAFRKIKIYEDILPVCMYCKDIRDDTGTEHGEGRWMSLETYLHNRGGARISHGCCPACYEKHKND